MIQGFLIGASILSLATAAPQSNFFGGNQQPQAQTNGQGNSFQLPPFLPSVQQNTGNAVAGGALLIPGIFAAKNILEGNNNINLRPQLGLGFNTQTGQLAPQLGVAAEIGEGDVRYRVSHLAKVLQQK